MKYILRENMNYLGIECDDNLNIPDCLASLIEKSYEKYQQKAVVLIDEYDKPILDNITDPEMLKYTRNSLKSFYEILKKSDRYLRFVFLTGVSKFSRVSIFSGLNNIEDISLASEYGNICGYTHHDIETLFKRS